MKLYIGDRIQYWRLWGFTFRTGNKLWFCGVSRSIENTENTNES